MYCPWALPLDDAAEGRVDQRRLRAREQQWREHRGPWSSSEVAAAAAAAKRTTVA